MYKTMHILKNRSKDKKGFTLAELLIVVAIIAVLVAIAVPIFSGQLEKAREATDVANIRTAYAVATIAAMEQSKDVYAVVELTQKETGFNADFDDVKIGGKAISGISGASVCVCVTADGVLTFETTAPGSSQRIDPITGANI